MENYHFIIASDDAGKRLDQVVVEFAKLNCLGFSREFIQKMILTGQITVKNCVKVKAHYKVKPSDEVSVQVKKKEPVSLKAEDIPLVIVYEDQDLAVIDKPVGLVVHPAPGNDTHTLVNAILFHFKDLSDINPLRPGIVHRLDKDTSGLLVIAKNNPAHLALAEQFARHSIKRKYVALVNGEMEFNENIIELPIGRHPYKRKDMAVGFGANTKYAKTFYRVLMRKNGMTLVELEPFTGRTHQLRVHLAYLKHPIMGDPKYGRNNKFTRLALHAKYLGFVHPRTGKFMEFSSLMPKEFEPWRNI